MSIYKKDELIRSYPAYDVYRRQPQPSKGWVNITADDELVMTNHLGSYRACSIVSYALENNQCPIDAVARCRQNMVDHPHEGHKLHWINALSTALTDGQQKKRKVIEVDFGMFVRFEGLLATIEKAPNNNIEFKQINKVVDAVIAD